MNAAVVIAECRRRSGLSLRALAELAGTSHSTIAAYEAGRKIPTTETLDRLIRAAGFRADVELSARIDGGAEMPRGEELEAVLQLAEQFPARHAPFLNAPVFGR